MSKTHVSFKARDGTAVQSAHGPISSSSSSEGTWTLRDYRLSLAAPVVMGIVNMTPDSFSEGGVQPGIDAALEEAAAHIRAGAAIVDVGGESTRPGASPVPPDEEMERILPFLCAAVRTFDVPFCVDTRKSEVAQAALDAGAAAINDVSGLRHDPAMAGTVASSDAGIVIMHMRGQPSTMSTMTDYDDLMREVRAELVDSVTAALAAGVHPSTIVLDPGIGFAKTASQSLTVLRDLDRLTDLGYPLLVGPSRKSFLGSVLGLPPGERVEGTVAACVAAYRSGARLFRVHDVGPVVRALAVARAISEPELIA